MIKKIILLSVGLVLVAGASISGTLYLNKNKVVEKDLGASVLQVYQGGTGNTTFGAGLCLKGNGTGAITAGDCAEGSGIATLNGLSTTTQTFATSSDTNIWLTITSTSSTHTFTPSWVGTLANDRIASSSYWKGYADFSNTATGLTYNSSTGETSLTAGYMIPTTVASSTWDAKADYSFGANNFNGTGNFVTTGTASATTILGDISSTTISANTLSGAELITMNDYINYITGVGHLNGGALSVVSPGIISVASGNGAIRATNTESGNLVSFAWTASSSIAVGTTSVVWVGIDYNAGSPIVTTKLTNTWNFHTEFPLGNAVSENGSTHILNNPHTIADGTTHILERLYETEPFKYNIRDGGGVISNTGTRNIAVTAYEIYDRNAEFNITAKDTSASDVFTYYYRKADGTFNFGTSTQWNNTQYDDGSGTLATLNNNYYGNHWVYQDMEDETASLILVYGRTNNNSLATALAQTAPATVPLRITAQAKLIGRIIFKNGDATPSQIVSYLSESPSGTAVSDHNNLGGLQGGTIGEYYHLTSARWTELTSWLDVVTLSGGSMSDITSLTATNASTTNLTVATESNLGTIKSGIWNGTAIDISSYTNLSITATGLVLSGDAIALDTGYEIPLSASTTQWKYAYDNYSVAETTSTIGALINGSTATTAPADTDRFAFSASSLLRHITWANIKTTLKTYFDTLYGAITGQIWTGTHDFGGATLEIPNGASNSFTATGQTFLDTTSDHLMYNGTATRTLTYIQSPTVIIASTTLTGGSGTTTIPLGFAPEAETWNSVTCSTDTGTSTFRFGDGTNYTSTITASSSAGSTALTTNNTFTVDEPRKIQVQSTTGSPNYISCTIKKTVNAD